MEIAIFAKKKKTREGKEFTSYFSHIRKKSGEEVPVSVAFDSEINPPKYTECPCNIIVAKADSNLATKAYIDETTGEQKESKTLWVNAYKLGSPYVDHSLDEYED